MLEILRNIVFQAQLLFLPLTFSCAWFSAILASGVAGVHIRFDA